LQPLHGSITHKLYTSPALLGKHIQDDLNIVQGYPTLGISKNSGVYLLFDDIKQRPILFKILQGRMQGGKWGRRMGRN